MANILDEIKAQSAFFSGVEGQIAELMLSDPKKFIEYSLKELATAAGVSQGSIINFSNKYAGGGFPSLKLKIAESLSSYRKIPYNAIDKSDGALGALIKNNQNTATALKNTEAMNSAEALSTAANIILSAKKIEIYGVFRSAPVATDFCYQLLQLGISASFVSDVLTCAVSASMLDKSSAVIAVSSSGKTKDVLDAVKIAKNNSVPIISLTSNKYSPLAKLSDVVLVAGSSGSSESALQNEIRNSQLALADALVSHLRNEIDENGEKCYSRLKNILNSHNVEEH